jgi:hypothetical protein
MARLLDYHFDPHHIPHPNLALPKSSSVTNRALETNQVNNLQISALKGLKPLSPKYH